VPETHEKKKEYPNPTRDRGCVPSVYPSSPNPKADPPAIQRVLPHVPLWIGTGTARKRTSNGRRSDFRSACPAPAPAPAPARWARSTSNEPHRHPRPVRVRDSLFSLSPRGAAAKSSLLRPRRLSRSAPFASHPTKTPHPPTEPDVERAQPTIPRALLCLALKLSASPSTLAGTPISFFLLPAAKVRSFFTRVRVCVCVCGGGGDPDGRRAGRGAGAGGLRRAVPVVVREPGGDRARLAVAAGRRQRGRGGRPPGHLLLLHPRRLHQAPIVSDCPSPHFSPVAVSSLVVVGWLRSVQKDRIIASHCALLCRTFTDQRGPLSAVAGRRLQ